MTSPANEPPQETGPAPKKVSWGRRIFLVLLLVFIGIQFIPVERVNPPVEADIVTPDEVKAILKRACYDCHSNETKWAWYGYVAPASWLLSYDVTKGREALNFSEWSDSYDEEETPEMFREICWHSIESGEMPLKIYLPLHPEAILTEQDLAILKDWAGVEAEEEEMEEDMEEAEETPEAGEDVGAGEATEASADS